MKKLLVLICLLTLAFVACAGEGQEDKKAGNATSSDPFPVISVTRNAAPVYSGTGPYPFGNVLPGESSNPVVFTVENRGSATLKLSAVSITGDSAADFSHNFTGEVTLAPAATTDIQIIFSPSTAVQGSRYAQLNITHNDTGADSPYGLKLSGYVSVKSPEIHISDALNNSLLSGSGQKHFGTVLEGASSAAHNFTIENLGNETLTISGITISDSTNFTLTSGSALTSLNPKDSEDSTTDFSIKFNPASAGYKTATVTVDSNDADEGSYTFTVAGNASSSAAVTPEINVKVGSTTYLTASTYDFGDVSETALSGNKTFTVQNIGTAPLTINSVSDPGGEFSRTASGLPAILAMGSSYTFTVSYNPTGQGTDSDSLTISSNDDDEASYVINLSGRGTGGRISLTPGTFPNTGVNITSAAQEFVITNTGNTPLTVSTVNLASGSDFIITSFPAGSIPAGSSSSFYVSFTPTTTGLRGDTLRIYTDDVTNSPSLNTPISGTGTINPMLTLLSAPTTFGSVNVTSGTSEQTYTVKNDGTTNLIISAIDFTGAAPGDYLHLGLPAAITPGNTGTFTVQFDPTATGARSATINITSNAGVTPIAVSGTGILQDINIATTTYTLYATTVGSTSAAQTITISNSGSNLDTLNITSASLTTGATGQFKIESYPSSSVLPSMSTNVIVSFKPIETTITANTLYTAMLRIQSNDPDENPIDITLNGTAHPNPVLTMLADPTNYGSVTYGESGPAQTYIIRNDGTTDLRINDITLIQIGTHLDYGLTLAPNFSSFPTTIAPGTSKSFTNTFTPGEVENGLTDTLRISYYDASGSIVNNDRTVSGNGISTEAILVMTLAPTNFGSVNVGASSPDMTFRIKNSGTGNLVLSDIIESSGHTLDFTITTGAFPATVGPGDIYDFTVTFSPTAIGARDMDITIESNLPDYTFTVNGNGVGVPEITMAPPSTANFGTISHLSTASNNFTIDNTGSGTLTVSNITLSDSTNFNLSATPPYNITTGTESFTVTYNPSSGGTHNAVLSIFSNDTDEPVYSIAITGTAQAPVISLGGSTDFGSVVNGTPKTQNFTIFNTGTDALNVTGITTASAQFSDPAFTGTILAGASQTISITFTPAAAAVYNDAISITSDDPATPTLNVPISGTGVNPPVLTTNPVHAGDINFPNTIVGQSSVQQNITISNTGSSVMTISSIGLSDATNFTITNTGSSTVPAGSSTVVSVVFNPASAAGFSETINVTTDGGTSIIDLNGTGEAPAPILVTVPVHTGTLSFPDTIVGQSSAVSAVEIKNTGNSVMTISNLVSSLPAVFVITNSGSSTVLPGTSTYTYVQFVPAAASAYAGTLAITSDGGSSTINLAGTGIALAPAIAITPLTAAGTPAEFGNTIVNQSSAARIFQIKNTGTADLNISTISLTAGDVAQFSITNSAEPVVAPGDSTFFSVIHNPSAAAVHTAHITVGSDATDPVIYLRATGTAPDIDDDPTTGAFYTNPPTVAAFASVAVGTESGDTAVTITNYSAAAPLTISGILLTGSDASDFIIASAPAFPLTIAASASDNSIKLRFKPQSASPTNKNATLIIYSNDPDAPAVPVALSATVLVPDIAELEVGGANPGVFGATNYLSDSAPQTLLISNGTGTAPLQISNVSISGANPGDFSLSLPALPFTLASGANSATSFQIRFRPTAAGARAAIVSVHSNDPDDPVKTIAVSGTGNALPVLTINGLVAAIDDTLIGTQSVERMVSITNSGGSPLDVYADPVLGGSNADQFELVTNNPISGLAATAINTSDFGIRFKPTSKGTKTATLSFDSSMGPKTLNLSATAVSNITIDSAGDTGKWTAIAVRQNVSLLAMPAGTIYVCHINNANALVFMRSVDGGATWTGPTNIDAASNFSMVSMDIVDGTSDDLWVSYYDVTNQTLKTASSIDSGTSWSAKMVESSGSQTGQYSSIGYNSDNSTVYISYYDSLNSDLKLAEFDAATFAVAAASGPIGTSYDNADLDTDGGTIDIGSHSSLAIDAGGLVHIAYQNTTGSQVRHLRFDPTVPAVDQLIDVYNFDSSYHSLFARSTGNGLYLACFDVTASDLNFAYSVDGSSWAQQWIDQSIFSVGEWSSIIVDYYDDIHVAYYDATNTRLKHAVNNGSWVISTVDNSADVGQYCSIASHDDTIYIIYYDVTNGDLRLAKSIDAGASW